VIFIAAMEDETGYWRQVICDLQDNGMTLEKIAEYMGVSDRQVSNWKNGDRPKGLTALKLYMLHVERM
jgi:transposase